MHFITIVEKGYKRSINLDQITYFTYEGETTKISMVDGQTVYIRGDITGEIRKLISVEGTHIKIEVKE